MNQGSVRVLSTTLFAAVIALESSAFGVGVPQQADNTATNKRDRSSQAVTADRQSQSKSDRDLTAEIRKEIIKDKDLSTYAHNAKVIVRGGAVTLRGPVRSEDEKTKLAAIATRVAGGDKVTNQLEVTPPSGK